MAKKKHKHDLDMKDAAQLIKVVAVILRDHSPANYHDASLALAYCWRHTESIADAEKREAGA